MDHKVRAGARPDPFPEYPRGPEDLAPTSALDYVSRTAGGLPSTPVPAKICRGRTMKISFAEPDQPRSGAVVVGVWEEGVLTPAARRLDEATSGAISRALS